MAKLYQKEGDSYTEVDAFLQPEVDEIVGDRLKRERAKFSDYEPLKEKAAKVDTIEAEWKTKLEAVGTEKSELEKKLAEANLNTEKVKIVHEFKLPDDLAEFVTGDSADVMRTKAEKLAKGVKPGSVDLDKKPKPTDDKATDSKKMAGKLFGPKAD